MNEETLADKIERRKGNMFDEDIIFAKDVKEFIKFEKARRENQLRIHWKWLKNRPYEEVVKFLNATTDKLAGENLI